MSTKNLDPNLGSQETKPDLSMHTSLFVDDVEKHMEIVAREKEIDLMLKAEGKQTMRERICGWNFQK